MSTSESNAYYPCKLNHIFIQTAARKSRLQTFFVDPCAEIAPHSSGNSISRFAISISSTSLSNCPYNLASVNFEPLYAMGIIGNSNWILTDEYIMNNDNCNKYSAIIWLCQLRNFMKIIRTKILNLIYHRQSYNQKSLFNVSSVTHPACHFWNVHQTTKAGTGFAINAICYEVCNSLK